MFDTPWEWEEADLVRLINEGTEESLTLEYKDSRSLGRKPEHKKEICKDVSALANSAGGTIVYGIPEKDHKPQPLDNGVDPNEFSKEWLEDIIHSGIQPRIEVRIKPVALSHSLGRVAYVVHVPQSMRTPHQVMGDRLYYKRYNFKAEAMYDYEIRDLMNRSLSPSLEVMVGFRDKDGLIKTETNLGNPHNKRFPPFEILIGLENTGEVLIEYASFTFYVFKPLIDSGKIHQMEVLGDSDPSPFALGLHTNTSFRQLADVRFPFAPMVPLRRDWHVGAGDPPIFGGSMRLLDERPFRLMLSEKFVTFNRQEIVIGWELIAHRFRKTIWGHLVCNGFDLSFRWLPEGTMPS